MEEPLIRKQESMRFARLEPTQVARLNQLGEFLSTLDERDREQERYGDAAQEPEACLCTPVSYELDMSHIPERILEVDFGCGDPTVYARPGDTVLDLGSGSGKHCFLMARAVGPEGHVIGIDKTPEMLELSRGAVDEVTQALGYPKPMVEFRRGCIEELRWDLDRVDSLLATEGPPQSYEDLQSFEEKLSSEPLVASDSVDLIVSNCVLNLVADDKKTQLFDELFRVLKRGGRLVISDIVANEDVPDSMKEDAKLWTGCVSGALRRDRFIDAFLQAGFYGIQELSSFHWRSEQGIEFHSVTISAYKGKQGPCWETYRQAYYVGPFSAVEDDDGHRYERGRPVPVCEKTAKILSQPPYQNHFLVSEAQADEAEQIPFDCSYSTQPDAQRQRSSVSLSTGGAACDPESGCC